jgi:phosphatidylglycerophosphate synthase
MLRRYVPNALSMSRIGIALLILIAAADLTAPIFVAVVVMVVFAMASDWADGFLARRWQVCSDLGYVLDAMGDRAIHLSLTLVVLVRYQISPVFVWLLIFRDILIYAIRVMSNDWLAQSRRLQWISRAHATLLRIWLCSYFVRDGIRIFTGTDRLDSFGFSLAQTILLSTTITISYWGIAKSLRWLQDASLPPRSVTGSQN